MRAEPGAQHSSIGSVCVPSRVPLPARPRNAYRAFGASKHIAADTAPRLLCPLSLLIYFLPESFSSLEMTFLLVGGSSNRAKHTSKLNRARVCNQENTSQMSWTRKEQESKQTHSPAETWKATASRRPGSSASLVSTAQPGEVSAQALWATSACVAVGGAWGHPAHPIGQLCLPALCVGHRMNCALLGAATLFGGGL